VTNKRKTHEKQPTPSTIEATATTGCISFFSEAYQGEGEEGAGLMLLQVQIHPLPDNDVLFNEITEAMNAAAAKVLKQHNITLSETPDAVHDASFIEGDDTKVQ
jgi:hypothetical protein